MAKQANTKRASRKATGDNPRGTFINPLSDFGFKHIFGEEANKDLLIDFLNAVLDIKGKIKTLEYRNVEYQGDIVDDRGARFDLNCTTGNGEDIIIEVQNLPHEYYRDRALYYAAYHIQKQAIKGKNWDFCLKALYSVNVMNFSLSDDDQFIYYVQLMDKKNKSVFYDKLAFVFIELPDFSKPEKDLKTGKDTWLYSLKHLEDLTKIPDKMKNNKVFQKLFEVARIANLTPEEFEKYNKSLKIMKMYTVDDAIKSFQKGNAEKDKKIAELSKENAEYQREITRLKRILGLNGTSAQSAPRATKARVKA